MKSIAILLGIIVILSTIIVFLQFDTDDINKVPAIDSDNDGFYDQVDAFPDDIAASVDTDGDGYPDRWNPGKSQGDSTSNLSIDDFPDDPSASLDTDGDGYPDRWNPGKSQGDSTSIPPLEIDEFPNDKNAYKDTDKDGIADYYDINDLVDLSLNIKLQKFKVTKKVDLIKWAQVYFEVYIDGQKFVLDNNGRNWKVWLNQEKTISHDSIKFDIPDDTKKEIIKIEIVMMDNDLFGTDDVIDLNVDSLEKKLILEFDNVKNSVSDNGIVKGPQAVLWYDIIYPENEIPDKDSYNRTYSWSFNNKNWKFSMKIPVDLYDSYINYNIRRHPQSELEIRKYITSKDEIVKEISNTLLNLAKKENFNTVETVNFILAFVQRSIVYTYDNVSKGINEYWRFPVESLVDKQGDCEDSSVLFASIMKCLDYDVVLLLYTWEENNQNQGHLAVGVNLDGFYGSYVEYNGKKYFYCETTTISYVVGKLPPTPPEIHEDPEKIIHV
ncbi:hypothetical protein AYK20_00560 [Thermoplasmatales archaeon SG8-52-1]|nr:MAG: hypothetical protein AYK20_00560 [Thermoplasmatales archaeon SG8-52-1]